METSRTAVLIVCVVTLVGCATGSSIVTGSIRPAIDPNDVKLYLKPPLEYETIGIGGCSIRQIRCRSQTGPR